MECPNCGKEIDESSQFCTSCGAPLGGEQEGPVATGEAPPLVSPPPGEPPATPEGYPPPPAVPRPAGQRTSGWAVASLVMGLLGFTCLFFVGAILAIVFGFIGRHDIRASEGRLKGSGLATAGITLGIVLVALVVLFAAIVLPISFLSVGPTRIMTRTVASGGARAVDANIDFNNGDLKVSGGANALMQGTFTYNVSKWRPVIGYSVTGGGTLTTVPGETGNLSIRQPSTEWWRWWQWLRGRNDWDIRLGGGIPVSLNVDQGWGSGELDLAGVNLTALDASSSAGRLTVGLGGTMQLLKEVTVEESAGKLSLTMDGSYPAMEALAVDNSAGAIDLDLTGRWTRNLKGNIRNSAGSITVSLPSSVGVYVTARTTAGRVSATGLRTLSTATSRGTGIYVNDAYGTSQVTLNLDVSNSAGRILLELE